MTPADLGQLDRHARRKAIRLAYWNGGLWAVGNGLTSTMLIIYLAQELGALGLAVGAIVAAPRLLGLARLGAPALLARIASRRAFCVWFYALSNLLLLLLPVCSAPGVLGSPTASLAALVLLWSGYHLLEFFATIALWSWFHDLVPRQVRGRFFGQRERFLTVGRIAGMLASGAFAYVWRASMPGAPRWLAYAIPAGAGALVMLLAVAPLAHMADPKSADANAAGRASLGPALRNAALWRLVAFGIVFSFVNGTTQAPQAIYAYRVLEFSLLAMMLFRSVMFAGQSLIGPRVGWLADRFGNRPVMVVSQVLIALGPLFHLLSTPERRWPLAVAYVAWIAYAGINVGLPAMLLKLGDRREASPRVSIYFAVTGLAYGCGTLLGGALFDWMTETEFALRLGATVLDPFGAFFLFGTVGRLLAALLLVQLIEPGAFCLRDLVSAAARQSRN
ncbi:MAG: MFS transporter [Planctomycetales bacterium]|nr:MFS transporter [Planctomycetales bacterium]